ncbi:MAG: co-chaperone GroES [Candidatus Saccharimonadales bacterium]
MSQPLTPLADRVIATREEAATRTASGLYLPDSAKEKAVAAVVESVGPDVKQLKKGDRIVYKEYTTTEIKIDDKEYLILKEEDVLAKVGK